MKKYTTEQVDADGFTTPDYWGCECVWNYIHPRTKDSCEQCGAIREEQPDAHNEEVAVLLLEKANEEKQSEADLIKAQPRVCAWCRHTVDEETGLAIRPLSDEEYPKILSHSICKTCADEMLRGA